MKIYMATAAILLGAASTLAIADDNRTPPKTMGDSGKLPATDKVGGVVPEMGATAPVESTGSHTMGDTGKLPATGNVSGNVPEMTPPPDSTKK
jgi:hypothetical protein